MKPSLAPRAGALLCTLLLACGQAENDAPRPAQAAPESAAAVELVQPAPPEVAAALAELIRETEWMDPGAAVARFEEFLVESGGYETDALVRHEIQRHRDRSTGRYAAARELAREGDFETAERVLVDLAEHLPDTADGRLAAKHLRHEFYVNQIQHLYVNQRFDEARRRAELLARQDLNETDRERLEQLRDGLGMVASAMNVIERQEATNATRQLLTIVMMRFAESGEYPRRLDLDEIARWDPYGGRSVARSLSRIENYRATRDGVSFVAVSTSGEHRIHVRDGFIEGAR